MTSKIKVDNINKVSDDSNIIKKCGSTTTVGSGSGTIIVDGSTVTIGRCGGTVALASGASQTGFGNPGQLVDWQTAIKTSGFTATANEGYFCNTTSGGFTVTLPGSPSVGAIVAFKDYANTFNSNNLILGRNSSNINGAALDSVLAEDGLSVTLIYADATKGWLVVNSGLQSEAPGPQFIAASGGTESTSGDFKIHKFTGPGTFTVSNAGNSAGSNKVDYLVIAGGGGGEDANGAGGGAGGYRYTDGTSSGCFCAGPSPLAATGLAVTATAFPIAVGAGGPNGPTGSQGSTSTFSSINSAGGGGGGPSTHPEHDGGSGAGGPHSNPPACGVGQGNTPPVSPPQGNNGGIGIDNKSGPNGSKRGGSGGGAGAVGGSQIAPSTNSLNPDADRAGGAGLTSSIDGTPTARGGGGGGGAETSPGTGSFNVSAGGSGGGGSGGKDPGGTAAVAGTVNTGGGGGGGGDLSPTTGKAGGSGIVIIRYKFQ